MASLRGHAGEINFDDLQHKRVYDHPATYNASKLANLLLAFACERRCRASGWGVASVAAHPGVARTNIVLDGPGPDSSEGWRFRNIRPMWQDPAMGALPLLYAGASSHAVGGGYYGPQGFMGMRGPPGPANRPANAQDRQLATRLWASLQRLSGASFG